MTPADQTVERLLQIAHEDAGWLGLPVRDRVDPGTSVAPETSAAAARCNGTGVGGCAGSIGAPEMSVAPQ